MLTNIWEKPENTNIYQELIDNPELDPIQHLEVYVREIVLNNALGDAVSLINHLFHRIKQTVPHLSKLIIYVDENPGSDLLISVHNLSSTTQFFLYRDGNLAFNPES